MTIENKGCATEAARQEADREHLEFFKSLISDGNLILGTLGFGLSINRDIPTMAFNHQTREVLINPDFIEKKNLSKQEQRYVFTHEIAHFVQLISDPEIYLATFDIAEERSQKYDDGAKQWAETAWNNFFNVFLDIHDNAIVDARSMWTQRQDKTEHPRRTLYEKMNPKDLRNTSKSEQFCFAILLNAMLDSEADLQIDPEIQDIINAPYQYAGQTHTNLGDFVRKHFFNPNLPLSVWLSKLNRTLIPIFEDLLKKDIASSAINQPQHQTELTGKGQDKDEIKKIVKGIKRARESGNERAKRRAQEKYSNDMKKQGFSDKEINQLEKIRSRVELIYPTLVDLWGAFIQNYISSDIVLETGFKSGESVDVDEFVRELPTLLTKPDQARFMERSVYEPMSEQERPKAIMLYILPDLSGSMDMEKRHAVQECTYALARSLFQYQQNKKLEAKDNLNRDEFRVGMRLIGFGSDFEDLFDRTQEEQASGYLTVNDQQELETRLARAILRIKTKELGGTCDDTSLREALIEISRPDTQSSLQSDDTVAVVLEITDGETTTAASSRALVQKLNGQKNVFARAIKIPGLLHADQPVTQRSTDEADLSKPSDIAESGAFKKVWEENGKRLDDLPQLKEVMLKILFATLIEKQNNI